VGPAFAPSTYGSETAFNLWLNVEDTAASNQEKIWVLDQAGWVDPSTEALTVDMSLLNGEVGYVGRVAMRSDFTPGGRVVNSASVTVLPLDAYSLYPQLEVLDVFAVLYWVYMLLTCGSRLVRDVRKARLRALRTGAQLYIFTGFTWWHALDVAAVVSFFTAIIQYAELAKGLANVGLDPQGNPQAYAWGPNAVGLGIATAAARFAAFKQTLVWVLGFLTLRLFFYFRFQPRLSVLVESISRAGIELLHYGIVFGVILAFFGVWGFFMFGALALEWSTPQRSMTTMLRLIQYDYNLDNMYLVS